MITARFDLRHLRLVLAVLAIALGMLASSPYLAHAEDNAQPKPDATAGAKKDCEKQGGTWKIDGTKATCTGMGWPKDYSCDLKINPNGTACSHLPKRVVRPGGNIVVVRDLQVLEVNSDQPQTTPTPSRTTQVKTQSSNELQPLEE